MVTRIVDFGMSPQNAITAPCWLHGRTWGAAAYGLRLEGRVPANVVEELRHRGHPVTVVDDFTDTWAMRAHPVSGVLQGATDPRGDYLDFSPTVPTVWGPVQPAMRADSHHQARAARSFPSLVRWPPSWV